MNIYEILLGYKCVCVCVCAGNKYTTQIAVGAAQLCSSYFGSQLQLLRDK